MSAKHDPYEYPVGERIKYFREKKRITTNKLANLAGISQSYLRDLELSNKNPTVELLYQICQALTISLKEFFDDETTTAFYDDPFMERIYRLNEEQKDALLKFLNTME